MRHSHKYTTFVEEYVPKNMFDRIVDTRDRIDFEIHDVNPSIVNGIRRCIIADVKTIGFAFDSIEPERQDIKFVKNTSALHNEFLGERLALTPIHISKADIDKFEKDSWLFELNVKSKPGDFTDVTTNDIKIVNTGKSDIVLDPKTVFPRDPITKDYIIIGRLKPEKKGQKEEIVLEARARHGCGDEHARWCPTSMCVSIPLPDKDKIEEERKKTTNTNEFETITKKQMYLKNKFIFSIETCCGMTPREIFECGIETLQSRFRCLGESILNKTPSKIKTLNPKPCGSIVIKLLGETDTAGFIIQQWLFDKVQFIGYFSPHPMEKSIIMTILPKDNGSSTPDSRNEEVFNMLHESCVEISKYLDNMINEWIRFNQK